MIQILELREENLQKEKAIHKLGEENLNLKRECKSMNARKKISLKRIKGFNKLNFSNISIESGPKAKFKPNLFNSKKLVINKNKIKNTNKSTIVERENSNYRTRDESKLDASFEMNMRSLLNQISEEKKIKEAIKIELSKINIEKQKCIENHKIWDKKEIASGLSQKLQMISDQIKTNQRKLERLGAEYQHQLKCRSVSPGSIALNNINKGVRNEDSYGYGKPKGLSKKELSPFKQEENSSFFSNENEISNIKYISNKSNGNFDEIISKNLLEIKNTNSDTQAYEKAKNMKHCLEEERNLKKFETSGSTESLPITFKDQMTSPLHSMADLEHQIYTKLSSKLTSELSSEYKIRYSSLLSKKDTEINSLKENVSEIKSEFETEIQTRDNIINRQKNDLEDKVKTLEKFRTKLKDKVNLWVKLNLEVEAERKRSKEYRNRIADQYGKIRVFCRIKPREDEKGEEFLKIKDDYTLEFEDKEKGS